MNDKLPAKTAKITFVKKLFLYGIRMYVHVNIMHAYMCMCIAILFCRSIHFNVYWLLL